MSLAGVQLTFSLGWRELGGGSSRRAQNRFRATQEGGSPCFVLLGRQNMTQNRKICCLDVPEMLVKPRTELWEAAKLELQGGAEGTSECKHRSFAFCRNSLEPELFAFVWLFLDCNYALPLLTYVTTFIQTCEVASAGRSFLSCLAGRKWRFGKGFGAERAGRRGRRQARRSLLPSPGR